MALSFGGSSNKSKTQSSSFTNVDSFSNRLGGSFNQQGSFIAPGQSPYLNALWSQGAQIAGQIQPEVAQQGAALGQQLGGIGMDQQAALGGISGGTNPFIQQLLARSQGNNPYISQQIAAYGQDISQNLQNNILPQIGSGFGLANQYGGGRQGVAEGLALQGAQTDFARGAADLRSNAYAQGQGAAGTALQAQLGAAGDSLGALQGQYELGLAGPMAGLLPLQSLQGLLGSPTVLSQGMGQSFDIASAASQTRSQAESKSKSKGGSFSFGL